MSKRLVEDEIEVITISNTEESNTEDKKDFIEWMRSGKLPSGKTFNGDGGYLIPDNALEMRKGFAGWFFRLIKSPRGFVNHNFVKELITQSRTKQHLPPCIANTKRM